MAQPSWIGHKLKGRYEIQELIGQGGMAAVYKAYDPNLRRVVALKLIHPHLSSDPEFVRRFEAEAASVAQLNHPHIIQIYDFDHDGDAYYIVFEFLPGETLQEHIKRLSASGRTMAYGDVARVGSQVAGALHFAHNRSLIHRDIKPGNIMLNFEGNATLMDFGIVKITGGTSHTATGAVLGTARYMAPEQIRGDAVDQRADIYALGTTLFQMVTGRLPFEAESAMTLMMMQVNDPIPDLPALKPDVPADLVTVITKSLHKDPRARYQSAGQMAQDLQNANLIPGTAGYTVQRPPAGLDPARTAIESAPGNTGTIPPPVMRGQQPPQAAPPRPQQPIARSTFVEPPPRPAPTVLEPAGSGAAPAAGAGSRRRTPLIAGCGILLLLALCAGALFGIFATPLGDTLLGRNNPTAEPTPEEVATVVAVVTEEVVVTPTQPAPDPTAETAEPTVETAPTDVPQATEVAEPTLAVQPTATPPPPTPTSPPPTATTAPPTATSAPTGPSVAITGISLSGSTYIVQYTTVGYTEALPGQHVHFFFNTVPPEQAGLPGGGPWYVWGGPRPFNGYGTGDKPAAATQMCALAANPDHSVIAGSGNCWTLP